jgi:hypothetical protein
MIKYYVGFFRNRDSENIYARTIMQTEGEDSNHVEILRFDADTNETICYGAVYPKSRKINLNQLEKTHYLVRAIPIEVLDSAYADYVLTGLMDKPYSFLQPLLIYLRIKIVMWSKWIPFVKLDLTEYLICTELVGEFLIDACGFKLALSQEMLGIKDVREILEKGK